MWRIIHVRIVVKRSVILVPLKCTFTNGKALPSPPIVVVADTTIASGNGKRWAKLFTLSQLITTTDTKLILFLAQFQAADKTCHISS